MRQRGRSGIRSPGSRSPPVSAGGRPRCRLRAGAPIAPRRLVRGPKRLAGRGGRERDPTVPDEPASPRCLGAAAREPRVRHGSCRVGNGRRKARGVQRFDLCGLAASPAAVEI
jgi:hypothetical protein